MKYILALSSFLLAISAIPQAPAPAPATPPPDMAGAPGAAPAMPPPNMAGAPPAVPSPGMTGAPAMPSPNMAAPNMAGSGQPNAAMMNNGTAPAAGKIGKRCDEVQKGEPCTSAGDMIMSDPAELMAMCQQKMTECPGKGMTAGDCENRYNMCMAKIKDMRDYSKTGPSETFGF
jgi:hypothetical protein